MLLAVLKWTGCAAVAMLMQEQVDVEANNAMNNFLADCAFLTLILGIISVTRFFVVRHRRNKSSRP